MGEDAATHNQENAREHQFLVFIFVVSLLLRVVLLFFLESYKTSDQKESWDFGFETGRIARSIANGDGFSSPFDPGNQPTAWLAPVYPYLLAGVFKCFGIYSQTSAIVILILNSIFTAFTCVLVYHVGKAAFNRETAVLASLIFAFYPPSIWHSISTIWNTTLTALTLTGLLLLVIRIAERCHWKPSTLCGVCMGLASLINPAMMSFFPCCFIWLFFKWPACSVSKRILNLLLITIVFTIVLSPWMVRNYRAFGQFVFIKSTLGVELRMGNNPQTAANQIHKLHPVLSVVEKDKYNTLGEIEYSRQCRIEVFAFAYQNPVTCLRLTLKSVSMFWFGDLLAEQWEGNLKHVGSLAVAKKLFFVVPVLFMLLGIVFAFKNRVDCSLFLLLLASYPLIYYLAHVTNRYRYPLEPTIILLASYGLVCLFKRTSPRGLSRDSGTA